MHAGEFAGRMTGLVAKVCVLRPPNCLDVARTCPNLPEFARICPNLPRICFRICQIQLVDLHVTMCIGLPVWPRWATMLTRTWHSCFVFSLRATMHARSNELQLQLAGVAAHWLAQATWPPLVKDSGHQPVALTTNTLAQALRQNPAEPCDIMTGITIRHDGSKAGSILIPALLPRFLPLL